MDMCHYGPPNARILLFFVQPITITDQLAKMCFRKESSPTLGPLGWGGGGRGGLKVYEYMNEKLGRSAQHVLKNRQRNRNCNHVYGYIKWKVKANNQYFLKGRSLCFETVDYITHAMQWAASAAWLSAHHLCMQ